MSYLFKLFLKVKLIWKSWNLRSFLILSFSLQCILILMASMRKRTSRWLLIKLIWLAYLLADWAAYYAIGLIPNGDETGENNIILHAFWAPFFLLHLGGPNTIAAFSVEDNELWNRSVLHLGVQASMTGFIIYRALPHNPLLAPTLLVFVSALARYIERVFALYNASMDVYKASVMDDYGGNLQLPKPYNQINEAELVSNSHCFFLTYRRIVVGLPIKFDGNLKDTKKYFLSLKTEDAFKQLEVHMNLMYYIFYTKAWLIVEEKEGKFFHRLALCSELVALMLWYVADKGKYQDVDIRLTNTLLYGAVVVDVVSLIELFFSDLMIPRVTKWKFKGKDLGVMFILNMALQVRNNKWCRWLFSRWSGSISQYNLMQSIVSDVRPQAFGELAYNMVRKVVMEKLLGLNSKGVCQEEVSVEMRSDVMDQLKARAKYATTRGKSEEVCSKIGAYVRYMYEWEQLDQVFEHAGLVDALLLWHLVTELYYLNLPRNQKMPVFTKQLSEYLMYLLVHQPTMIAEGVGIPMYENTCSFLREIYTAANVPSNQEVDLRKILKHVKKKSGESTMRMSMLNCAHCMKDHLLNYGHKEQAEEIIKDIWIELLFHVAIRCRARAHLKQVSNGGEFLTLVWLMMTYLGLTTNFVPERVDIEPIVGPNQRDELALSVVSLAT